jgi:hypothetical protein
MDKIKPLEYASRKIHTISNTEIMPFDIYCDISRYVIGGSTNGHKMSALHSLRNAVISRRADSFVDAATFALQLHQLSIPKPKTMDNSRTLAITILLVVTAFVAIFCMTWLRIERLEQKVERMQQKIGYYESDTP